MGRARWAAGLNGRAAAIHPTHYFNHPFNDPAAFRPTIHPVGFKLTDFRDELRKISR
jgi:hypothetical protein